MFKWCQSSNTCRLLLGAISVSVWSVFLLNVCYWNCRKYLRSDRHQVRREFPFSVPGLYLFSVFTVLTLSIILDICEHEKKCAIWCKHLKHKTVDLDDLYIAYVTQVGHSL